VWHLASDLYILSTYTCTCIYKIILIIIIQLQLGMYTEEPLLRWLKDFCGTAAPY
jgi:hypothetical protein